MTHATLCELMRQHELDFTAPADRAPAARPLARPRLLILACSSSKAEGEDLSARDRYTGPLWQTLKAADPDGSLAHVAFLSARYGFGHSRDPLPHYNTLLTAKTADTMIQRGLAGYYPNYDLTFRTQGARDRPDDLLTGGRDDDHVAPAQLVVGDQLGCFGKHERIHDVVQRLADHRLDLLDVPARAHRGDVGAHPVHLVVVGAGHRE